MKSQKEILNCENRKKYIHTLIIDRKTNKYKLISGDKLC